MRQNKNQLFFLRKKYIKKTAHTFPSTSELSTPLLARGFVQLWYYSENLIKTNISHVYHWNYISGVSECDIWRMRRQRWGVYVVCRTSESTSREWAQPKSTWKILIRMTLQKNLYTHSTGESSLLISSRERGVLVLFFCVLTQILLTNFLFIFALYLCRIFHHIMWTRSEVA